MGESNSGEDVAAALPGHYTVVGEDEALGTSQQMDEMLRSEETDEMLVGLVYDPRKIPCYRDAMLFGMGAGGIAGMSRYFRTGRGITAGNWAVGGFLAASTVFWFGCRRLHVNKVEMLREAARETRRKQELYKDRMDNDPLFRARELSRLQAQMKKREEK